MSYAKKNRQALKDYQYLKQKYGDINDYCGLWCINDRMDALMESPSHALAYEYHKELIAYYFYGQLEDKVYHHERGILCTDVVDYTDKKVIRINKRYGFK